MSNTETKKQITKLVINNSIKNNIPTIIFLSTISSTDLMKNIISTLLNKPYETDKFTPKDWQKLSDIITLLSKIPVLTKDSASIKIMVNQAKDFITSMEKRKGLIIFNTSKTDTIKKLEYGNNIVIKIID